MTYIKINDIIYPAIINGKMEDREWDKRESKTVTLEMNYATAATLFVDGVAWSIVCEEQYDVPVLDNDGNQILDDEGNPIFTTETHTEEFDNSDFSIAGPITDNRDGTMTVKMGKFTNEEMLLMEVLS